MVATINWDTEKVLYETLRLGLEEGSMTQEAYQAIFEEARKNSGGNDYILVPFEQLVEQYHPEWMSFRDGDDVAEMQLGGEPVRIRRVTFTVEGRSVDFVRKQFNREAEPASAELVRGEKEARDDLKIIEGIGPKIEQLLNAKGIYTFEALAVCKPDWIRKMLQEAGPNYAIHDPGIWPKQSQLAATGQWDALKKLQDQLD